MTQQIISICGIKNSGKTTLVTKLVSRLSGEGYKVAVIKHDGHDFTCDVPGTDTYRFTENGAYGVACFSDHRIFVHKQGTGEREEALLALFPEADLILVEGLKDSTLPKIEVIRRAISDRPASNPAGRFLIATDWPAGTFDEPTADLEDAEGIAKAIGERVER
ncbi:MAG: molybdopterin-guanine dinucleotide biosynthesis protein B [Mogibacterium sp.]|nr:molybdopterin-guanine dinucleotide biosynthesis protein B [Mogibacterium sp.]